jgi:threonine dehydrogenase-like Zn-dependent dehydrogenase
MPKLAVLTAAGGPFELTEFPLTTPAPGTVALKLRMAGICGSDLHIFKGELPMMYPFASGREMVGEIAELGEGVVTDAQGTPLAVGDRVVTPYFWTCGSCAACSRGATNACQNLMAGDFRLFGQEPYFISAHGEYYYTHRLQPLYKVPEELSDAQVAPLNCALAQVLFALRDVRLGDTVVIQGAGGLGINAAAVARTAGASRVIVVDMLRPRRQDGAFHAWPSRRSLPRLKVTFGTSRLTLARQTASRRPGSRAKICSKRCVARLEALEPIGSSKLSVHRA